MRSRRSFLKSLALLGAAPWKWMIGRKGQKSGWFLSEYKIATLTPEKLPPNDRLILLVTDDTRYAVKPPEQEFVNCVFHVKDT